MYAAFEGNICGYIHGYIAWHVEVGSLLFLNDMYSLYVDNSSSAVEKYMQCGTHICSGHVCVQTQMHTV